MPLIAVAGKGDQAARERLEQVGFDWQSQLANSEKLTRVTELATLDKELIRKLTTPFDMLPRPSESLGLSLIKDQPWLQATLRVDERVKVLSDSVNSAFRPSVFDALDVRKNCMTPFVDAINDGMRGVIGKLALESIANPLKDIALAQVMQVNRSIADVMLTGMHPVLDELKSVHEAIERMTRFDLPRLASINYLSELTKPDYSAWFTPMSRRVDACDFATYQHEDKQAPLPSLLQRVLLFISDWVQSWHKTRRPRQGVRPCQYHVELTGETRIEIAADDNYIACATVVDGRVALHLHTASRARAIDDLIREGDCLDFYSELEQQLGTAFGRCFLLPSAPTPQVHQIEAANTKQGQSPTAGMPRSFCRFRVLLVQAEWRDFLFAADALSKGNIETDTGLTLKWESTSDDLSEWNLLCIRDDWGSNQEFGYLGTITATPLGNQVALILSEYNGADWQTINTEREIPPHPEFLRRIAQKHHLLITHAKPMLERLHAREWPVDAFTDHVGPVIQALNKDALLIDFTTPPLDLIELPCQGKRSDVQAVAKSFVERISGKTVAYRFQVDFDSKAEWTLVAFGGRGMFIEPRMNRKVLGKFRLIKVGEAFQLSFALSTSTPLRPREWAIALPFVAGLIQELRRVGLARLCERAEMQTQQLPTVLDNPPSPRTAQSTQRTDTKAASSSECTPYTPREESIEPCKTALRHWLDEGKAMTPSAQLANVDVKTLKKAIPAVLDVMDDTTRLRWVDALKQLGKHDLLGKYSGTP